MATDLQHIAQSLHANFLEHGNYTFASKGSGYGVVAVQPASGGQPTSDYVEPLGFAGLSVFAIGIDEDSDDPGIRVYVTKGRKEYIKSLQDGDSKISIRVSNIGKMVINPEQASSTTNRGNLFKRGDAIACGSSCAPVGENHSGTFGAIIEHNGNHFVLSNNHVISGCNHIKKNISIISPSNLDVIPNVAPREIGRHHDLIPLCSGDPIFIKPCSIDAGIAQIHSIGNVSSWQGDVNGYDTPSSTIKPKGGMPVKKFGRTTGMTTGYIDGRISVPFPMPYKSQHFNGTVWFNDVWSVRATDEIFALGGDSGSLVVSDDGQHAVGLLFAASPKGEYAVIIPIDEVLACWPGSKLTSNLNL